MLVTNTRVINLPVDETGLKVLPQYFPIEVPLGDGPSMSSK